MGRTSAEVGNRSHGPEAGAGAADGVVVEVVGWAGGGGIEFGADGLGLGTGVGCGAAAGFGAVWTGWLAASWAATL